MTDKLKPCPFCGGENVGVFSWNPPFRFTKYSVHCYDCHFGLYEVDNEEDAIKAWNTRKPMNSIVGELQEDEKRWRESGTEFKDATELGIAQGLRLAIKIVKGVQNE